MICLFFDTSSDILKLSLLRDENIIYDKEIKTKNNHNNYLVPFINDAFSMNSIDFKQLNKIIVGIGPGSFTGTRIAITVAKVYAISFNIPLIPVSSLEELIYNASGYDYYVPIIEEKADNLYFSIFDKDKKRIYDDSYTDIDNLYNILEKYNGKIAVISYLGKQYQQYDCYKGSINIKKLIESIEINNEYINPHLLKPNYIKKIEVESKL